jgi:hypothetical protein
MGEVTHHQAQYVRQRRRQLQRQRRTAVSGGQEIFHARGRMAQQPRVAGAPDINKNPAAPGVGVLDVAQPAAAGRCQSGLTLHKFAFKGLHRCAAAT